MVGVYQEESVSAPAYGRARGRINVRVVRIQLRASNQRVGAAGPAYAGRTPEARGMGWVEEKRGCRGCW